MQVASVGAVTLLLGLLSGWFLHGSSSTTVEVDEAIELNVRCGDVLVSARGSSVEGVWRSGRCEVRATMADGSMYRAEVDVVSPGHYLCSADAGGVLECGGL